MLHNSTKGIKSASNKQRGEQLKLWNAFIRSVKTIILFDSQFGEGQPSGSKLDVFSHFSSRLCSNFGHVVTRRRAVRAGFACLGGSPRSGKRISFIALRSNGMEANFYLQRLKQKTLL